MFPRKFEPVSDEAMADISPKYTICEVLREIYWLADDAGINAIKEKARLATSMAKSIVSKLADYSGSDTVMSMYDNHPDMANTARKIRELRMRKHVS